MDLTGQRFGRLTVLDVAERGGGGVRWRCLCDCGNETVGRTGHLRAGSKTSCGCAVAEMARFVSRTYGYKRRTHGISHSRLDNCYKNMLARCYNPKNKRYAEYGKRGISVCDEWRTNKLLFIEWANTNGYAANLTLDRMDVNKGYSPDNCRWADAKTQMNNMTKNVFLEWDGKRQTIAQWAEEIGVLYRALQHRVDRGWSVDRIFTQPWRKSPNTRKRL